MIELRPLAIVDLSMTYARSMGENKLRHYRVPATQLAIAKFTGRSAEDLVRDHIKAKEGETEVSFLPYRTWEFDGTPKEGVLQAKDITDLILKDSPEVRQSLEKVKVDSLVHQYNIYENKFKEKFLGSISRFINRFLINPINEYLREFQLKDVPFEDRMSYLFELDNLKLLPYLPEFGPRRAASPCSFLSVAFHEDDIERATALLLKDLCILQEKGLILGHLAMPSMLILADTVGSGKGTFAMFCFLFLDQEKSQKLLGLNAEEMPRLPLTLLGVQTESVEGGITYLDNKSPSDKYQIEVVNVGDATTERDRAAVIDMYNATKDAVNEAAKRTKERIDTSEILNKHSVTIGDRVYINADIKDKNAKIETLS